MKLLSHPNVLGLYDVWETNSNLYLILEYAEKGELFNLLVDHGPCSERGAINCFRQIIIGISYCHALGIVHRDLKPENLLLDSFYNIKIADFGMAALYRQTPYLLETSCGSPHYAAPEIVSGLPYEGFASDVWSCGVILFAF
ncbi:AKR_collapsed_G0005520.mRNA.1.CDS.1 [Saccharomyces cerevisiae]|nr:AKR_collapsed_G0005520.mRNA.1.CDS.1 [Saccharomyces cerevisiae]